MYMCVQNRSHNNINNKHINKKYINNADDGDNNFTATAKKSL